MKSIEIYCSVASFFFPLELIMVWPANSRQYNSYKCTPFSLLRLKDEFWSTYIAKKKLLPLAQGSFGVGFACLCIFTFSLSSFFIFFLSTAVALSFLPSSYKNTKNYLSFSSRKFILFDKEKEIWGSAVAIFQPFWYLFG